MSLFKPVRVGEPVDLGPPPSDHFNERTLWWRHERLHRSALAGPGRIQFIPERDELERRWLSDPPESAAAFAQADELLRRWTKDLGATQDVRPWWVRRYWQERDRRAGLPPRWAAERAPALR